MRRSFMVCGAISALALAAGEAHAQTTGYAVDHFETSERGSEWLSLDSLDIQGHGRFALGLSTSWAYRPLYVMSGDRVAASIVRNQVMGNAGASFVLGGRVRLGVNVPLQLFADGHTANASGQAYAPPADEVSVGDMRVAADVRAMGAHGDPFVLAIGTTLHVPSGSAAAYTGDGKVRVGPRVQIAGDVGNVAYAARASFLYRARDEAFAEGAIGSEITGAASVGYRFFDRRLLIGPELLASRVVTRSSIDDAKLTPIEGLLGAHYTAGELRFGAGVGAGLTEGYGAPVARTILSVEWTPDVTPPPPKDSDGDGVDDAHDACPTAAGVATKDPTTNGCPLKDTDQDGITDDVDACPRFAGPRTDDERTNGCPVIAPPPAPVTAPPPCPDLDRDKDGITNDADACPDAPGKADPDPKKNGCPLAVVRDGRIEIAQMVRFKTDSAEILGKESDDVLQAVAKILADHPEIKLVIVQGHTDNKGAAERNRALSASRAASVVAWLTAHGIAADRLKSEGRGADAPLASNDTEEGRTKNRRVELHIVDRGGAQ